MQTGTICIVDADSDDREMITDIIKELKIPNELLFFTTGNDLTTYLSAAEESPFMVLSEVDLPDMDGFDLRRILLNSDDRRFLSVPFIFWSNMAAEIQIQKANKLGVHGFFLKPNSYVEMEQSFKALIKYWNISIMPKKR